MDDLNWQPTVFDGGAEFTGYAPGTKAISVQVRVAGEPAAVEDTAQAIGALLDGTSPSWPELHWAEHTEPAPQVSRQTWVFKGFPDGVDEPTVTVRVRGYDQTAQADVAAAIAEQIERVAPDARGMPA